MLSKQQDKIIELSKTLKHINKEKQDQAITSIKNIQEKYLNIISNNRFNKYDKASLKNNGLNSNINNNSNILDISDEYKKKLFKKVSKDYSISEIKEIFDSKDIVYRKAKIISKSIGNKACINDIKNNKITISNNTNDADRHVNICTKKLNGKCFEDNSNINDFNTTSLINNGGNITNKNLSFTNSINMNSISNLHDIKDDNDIGNYNIHSVSINSLKNIKSEGSNGYTAKRKSTKIVIVKSKRNNEIDVNNKLKIKYNVSLNKNSIKESRKSKDNVFKNNKNYKGILKNMKNNTDVNTINNTSTNNKNIQSKLISSNNKNNKVILHRTISSFKVNSKCKVADSENQDVLIKSNKRNSANCNNVKINKINEIKEYHNNIRFNKSIYMNKRKSINYMNKANEGLLNKTKYKIKIIDKRFSSSSNKTNSKANNCDTTYIGNSTKEENKYKTIFSNFITVNKANKNKLKISTKVITNKNRVIDSKPRKQLFINSSKLLKYNQLNNKSNQFFGGYKNIVKNKKNNSTASASNKLTADNKINKIKYSSTTIKTSDNSINNINNNKNSNFDDNNKFNHTSGNSFFQQKKYNHYLLKFK